MKNDCDNRASKPKVAIILLNWNGKKDTLECLASLEKASYPNREVIVVDNGSHDGSVQVIREQFPTILLIETFHNLGYAGGNNAGIDHAMRRGAEYILLLNNDTVVEPDFLSHMVASAEEKPRGGIFGAKILRYKEPEILDHMAGCWNGKRAEFDSLGYGMRDRGQFDAMQETDYVCGCAFLLRRSVVERVGKLDPNFFLLWEETDLCARAKRAGFEIWLTPKAVVWHKVSASFSGKALMHYYWWRNRLLWMRKNCSLPARVSLYRRVVLGEIFKIYKIMLLKTLQLFFCRCFFPHKITEKKLLKLKRYKAGCKGIRDYFLRRFGGPVTL